MATFSRKHAKSKTGPRNRSRPPNLGSFDPPYPRVILHRPSIAPDNLPRPATTFYRLLVPVVVLCAERLEWPSPKRCLVVTMRRDVIADGSRFDDALSQTHPAQRFGLKLFGTGSTPPGGAVQSPDWAVPPAIVVASNWRHHEAQPLDLTNRSTDTAHEVKARTPIFPIRRRSPQGTAGTSRRRNRSSSASRHHRRPQRLRRSSAYPQAPCAARWRRARR